MQDDNDDADLNGPDVSEDEREELQGALAEDDAPMDEDDEDMEDDGDTDDESEDLDDDEEDEDIRAA